MGTETAISWAQGSLLWTGLWMLTVALGAAIGFAQRDWLFELTGQPESERKAVYALGVLTGALVSVMPGYFFWPPILAVELGWLLHPLLRPWLSAGRAPK